MKPLTKAEEEIMQKLWELKKGFLREIMEEMPEPKPHQNTVSTLLKIMVEKGFVGIKPYGRFHQYYPLIQKEDYSKRRIGTFVKKYFEGSFRNLVSTLVKDDNLSVDELESLVKQLKKQNKA